MRAVSLFSGVGGFELGLSRAGIQTVLQVEIDPWCNAVLERHWPEVRRVGDVRQVDEATFQRRCGDVVADERGADAERLGGTTRSQPSDSVDLVYGGFPCQDVSVAGRRAGFRGERSSLWFEFERIVRVVRPRWVCVENVPGLFSSNGGADFLRILMDLDELGYGVAWRVLDARWFGVPQRRRRVFLVGCLGGAVRAQAVLAVCESCGGHSQASREAEQDTAPTLDDGARGTSLDLPMTASTLSDGGHPGSNLPGRHHEDDDNLVIGSEVDDGMARPLVARATGYRMDLESENFVLADPIGTREGKTWTHEGKNNFRAHNLVEIASPVRASDGHHGHSSPRGDGADNLIAWDDRNHKAEQDTHHTLRGAGLQRSDVVAGLTGSAGVRRLTPLECERLMGWPDEHTRYGADGKEIPDSHRYRMIGNGVVAPVAEWLGHRLVEVDAWL